MLSITSDAVTDSIPYLSFAISPALPCMYTAIAAAAVSFMPLAASDAVIPAKTSPLPPVARPGLPVY